MQAPGEGIFLGVSSPPFRRQLPGVTAVDVHSPDGSGRALARALDAIHVASAKLFADRTASQTFTFVSAGVQQINVAKALGIKVRYVWG